jgi:hypothetical protein
MHVYTWLAGMDSAKVRLQKRSLESRVRKTQCAAGVEELESLEVEIRRGGLEASRQTGADL